MHQKCAQTYITAFSKFNFWQQKDLKNAQT